MSEAAAGSAQSTPNAAPGGAEGAQEGQNDAQERSFTQAEVDRLVGQTRTDERRKVSARFADYDTLKAKAEGVKTAEERIAELENRLSAADARDARNQLVAEVAKEHGITDPDDIRLFLTGADRDTIAAQAARLSERSAASQPRRGHVPNEGRNTNKPASEEREAIRNLFGSA